MKKSIWTGLLSLAVIGAMALPAMAGGAGGGGGGGGGRGGRGGAGAGGAGAGGGRGGNFDPVAAQAARIEGMRPQLAPKDDAEWKVLSDKIAKILTLQNQLAAGRPRGGNGRGGRGGAGAGGAAGGPPAAAVDQTNPVAVAAEALTASAANATAAPEDLKGKMTALRDARKKIGGDLTTAQGELQKIVTVRQEAVLVSLGVLD